MAKLDLKPGMKLAVYYDPGQRKWKEDDAELLFHLGSGWGGEGGKDAYVQRWQVRLQRTGRVCNRMILPETEKVEE